MAASASAPLAVRLSGLLEPVSADHPCGPDLDYEGDGDYFNYILPADGRLSVRFYGDDGKLADRSNLNLQAEIDSACALLERSRDLRLVSILAQFHAVLFDKEGFLLCVQTIQALLETFWEPVHPQASDGDFGLRRSIVESLDDRSRVGLSLAYFPLFRDKKIGIVTYRVWEIAHSPELQRPGETPLQPALVTDALNSEDGREQIAASYSLFKDLRAALSAIRSIFIQNSDFDYAPSFPVTSGAVDDVIGMFEREAKWLLPANETASSRSQDKPAVESHDKDISPQHPISGQRASEPLTMIEVSTHAQAAAILTEVEAYFCHREPSSPALVLVHQARRLVGRPLVEALEALAPSRVDTARLVVDPSAGFALSIDKMRQLTSSAMPPSDAPAQNALNADPVVTRQAAVGAMVSVESFLAGVEPSSPVPVLLSRARTLMDKNFAGLLEDYFGGTKPD